MATREEVEKIENAPPGVLTNVEHYCPEFNRDQSHLVGRMDSISFPETAFLKRKRTSGISSSERLRRERR